MIETLARPEVILALLVAFGLGYLVRGSGRGTGSAAHLSPEEIDTALKAIRPDVWTEIDQAIDNRRKLHAIKLLREATGLGLKDSKEAVEAHMQSRHRMRG